MDRDLASTPEPVECEVDTMGAGWRLTFSSQRVLVEVPRTYWHSNGQLDATCVVSAIPVATADEPRRLNHGTINLSSPLVRSRWAKELGARGHDAPWPQIVDELAARILELVTAGDEPVVLTDLRVSIMPTNRLLGEFCIDAEPSMIFGAGGDGKSYVALACAASLAGGLGLLDFTPARAMRVAYLDWEWRPEEHARRLRQLVGDGLRLPGLFHFQCRRPLATIIDGLAVKFKRYGIEYAIVDSVGLACGGPPEKSEIATQYGAALRQLNVGTLSVAHINRSGDTMMPFGSVYFHNLMRSTWFLKRVQSPSQTLSFEMHNRKSNSAERAAPIAYTLTWDRSGRVAIAMGEVRQVAPLRQRIIQAMDRVGLPMTVIELALAVGPGADGHPPTDTVIFDTMKRAGKDVFVALPGAPTRWVLPGSVEARSVQVEADLNTGTPLDHRAGDPSDRDDTHEKETPTPMHAHGTPHATPGGSGVPDDSVSESSGTPPSNGLSGGEIDQHVLQTQRRANTSHAQASGRVHAGQNTPANRLDGGAEGSAEAERLPSGYDILHSLEERGMHLSLNRQGRVLVGPKELVDETTRALLSDPADRVLVVAALRHRQQSS